MLPGAQLGAFVQLPITETFVLEPCAAFGGNLIGPLGFGMIQLSAPFVLDRTHRVPIRVTGGVGPLLAHWLVFGHATDWPGRTRIGAEGFLRPVWRATEYADVFIELRAQLYATPEVPPYANPLVVASVGATIAPWAS